ncbi:MAG: hypothetical protein H6657_22845 [Ardenticatenaceae bacterium]|nr:hypothetical protein [Ardenticatenaceae bacterium]
MPKQPTDKTETTNQRVALTARLSLDAYDAIAQVQRQHRIQTGRALPIWKIIDTAVKTYAKQQSHSAGE